LKRDGGGRAIVAANTGTAVAMAARPRGQATFAPAGNAQLSPPYDDPIGGFDIAVARTDAIDVAWTTDEPLDHLLAAATFVSNGSSAGGLRTPNDTLGTGTAPSTFHEQRAPLVVRTVPYPKALVGHRSTTTHAGQPTRVDTSFEAFLTAFTAFPPPPPPRSTAPCSSTASARRSTTAPPPC